MPELIDRISLIDKLDQGQKNALDAKDFMSFYALVFFKVILQEAPTIEAEPVRHGRWLSLEGWFNKSSVKCSVCGNTLNMDGVNAGRGDANFCPNCGARMDGGAEQ